MRFVSNKLSGRSDPVSVSEHIIFGGGAGSCPKAPVAEGDPVRRRGEPTGLVPRGSGAKDDLRRHENTR